MVVLTMSSSPAKLTGDLTKWLTEIDTGVYVGNINSRVRDALWRRVCDNIGQGKAIMVYSTNNEQKMAFYTYNSQRTLVDCEGITLVKKPLPQKMPRKEKVSNIPITKKECNKKNINKTPIIDFPEKYIILDFETTGLDAEIDEITEIGLIKVSNNQCVDEYHSLVKTNTCIPLDVVRLTGITDQMLEDDGIELCVALNEIKRFVEDYDIVCYSSQFDRSFLWTSCQRCEMSFPENEFIDARKIIRKKLPGIENYKLLSVAKALNISLDQKHRALEDCELLYTVICKLNENAPK